MIKIKSLYNNLKIIFKSNKFLYPIFSVLRFLKIKMKYVFVKSEIVLPIANENVIEMKALITEEKRTKEETSTENLNIKFSILATIHNISPDILNEIIESCRNQTYKKWELIIIDFSDRKHKYIKKLLKKYAEIDNRIKYKSPWINFGYSRNIKKTIADSVGDYVSFIDDKTIFHPSMLYEVTKEITENNADFMYMDDVAFYKNISCIKNYYFKSDFAIDTLRSINYIGRSFFFSKKLFDKIRKMDSKYHYEQIYDIILYLSEKAMKISHVSKVLCYNRCNNYISAHNALLDIFTTEQDRKVIDKCLKRNNIAGDVKKTKEPNRYKIDYKIKCNPLVSILIPNCDHKEDLQKCIDSILSKSTYMNIEIIVVENNSTTSEIFQYYQELNKNIKIKVIEYKGSFNYSAINNFGIEKTRGEYIILLNNDTEVISNSWIEEMLMYCQRKDIGAVGAKLYYYDDTIQHAGVVIGLGGIAGHAFLNYKRDAYGYMDRLKYPQNVSAVTGACIMIKKDIFNILGGLDEKKFPIAFNDVDLCLKIRQKGYMIVWTPYAELYHFESKSRGYENTPEKIRRFEIEQQNFREKWKKELEAGDPYYKYELLSVKK